MKEITSLGNAVVKDVCNLKQKKYRERSGSFVIEGLRAVEDFLSCNVSLLQFHAGFQ